MRVTLTHDFIFEAAHQLPHAPKGHKCQRLHGHSWAIEVNVAGEIDEKTGWLVDYDELERVFAPVHETLDHRVLNEIEGLENPTSENLARWIWLRLKPRLPELSEIVVRESAAARCSYRGD